MCGFIILLLLLSRKCSHCTNVSADFSFRNDCGCGLENSDTHNGISDNVCGCDTEHLQKDVSECPGRMNDSRCGCEDMSSMIEREDIWSSYKNTSTGRQYK